MDTLQIRCPCCDSLFKIDISVVKCQVNDPIIILDKTKKEMKQLVQKGLCATFGEVMLIRKDNFSYDVFSMVSKKARKVIDSAKPDELIAANIKQNMSGRFEIMDAKLYNFTVFNQILSGKFPRKTRVK